MNDIILYQNFGQKSDKNTYEAINSDVTSILVADVRN